MGNEKQFRLNHSVEARFDSALYAIEKKKLDQAKKELEGGKKLLSERQKLSGPIDPSVVGPRFQLTLLTTWRILLRANVVFLKLKNRQTRPLTLKERNRGLNRVLLITNLIMLLFLMFQIHASALTTLAVKSFRQPFQFREAVFLLRSQFRRVTCFAYGSEGHRINSCPNLISSGRSDKPTK